MGLLRKERSELQTWLGDANKNRSRVWNKVSGVRTPVPVVSGPRKAKEVAVAKTAAPRNVPSASRSLGTPSAANVLTDQPETMPTLMAITQKQTVGGALMTIYATASSADA